MRIGILAIQGAFAEHAAMLQSLGVQTAEVRNRSDLNQTFDGFILPGGESTTISKLLRDLDLYTELQTRIRDGMPVMGTCAGLIVLAQRVEGGLPSLATLDITAVRNAYGRQLGSFETDAFFEGIGTVPMTFIRAPYVRETGPLVQVLSMVDGRIVAVRDKNQLALAYHPELTGDLHTHQYFLDMIS
jgi:5'-phosphate synthase pdxT subunit